MSVAIVNKLLHDPIVRLKDRGRQHDARIYVHAVRELFGLGSVSKDGSEAGRDRQARAAEGSARNEDVA